MQFYCTGTSFTRVEDPYLLRAIQLLRPGARLPTRKQLADDSSGGLLVGCYQKVKAEVGKLLSVNTQYICITSDAWSSVLNEPVVNYMAVCPTKSLFLEAIHTEDQAHDAEWLTADLTPVIDSIGDNVVGCVTDNTAANKKVWKELEQKYPNRFFHGCVSHGLNLLVKDIFAAKKKQPDGAVALLNTNKYHLWIVLGRLFVILFPSRLKYIMKMVLRCRQKPIYDYMIVMCYVMMLDAPVVKKWKIFIEIV